LIQFSLTAGKRTCALDLTKEEDKKQLYKLMEDADVILQSYRQGSLARKGFGLDDLLEMANRRGKGIIYLDLNCYGTDGYYAERPGWQQIADAVSGCSYVCGKAYGFPEGTGVLPSLPIADMLCGAAAAVSIMMAIRDRARHGGSYFGNSSLTATDTVQVSEDFGLYSPEVVKKIQDTHNFAPMTPDLHVLDLLSVVFSAWMKTTDVLKRNEMFTVFDNTPFGHSLRMLAPLVRYENAEASPKWLTSPKPYCYDEQIAFAGTT
jgi:CoA-transferase family III